MAKIVFMGTPEFAVPTLKALLASKHEVVAVYTKAPVKKDRGQQVLETPIHLLANEHNIEVVTPLSLKDEEQLKLFKSFNPDLAIVIAYGFILPQSFLEVPKLGCINIHASLLPRWHGAAPIQRAIEFGDKETGITFMQMDAGLDSGDMLFKSEIAITEQTTAGQVHDALSQLGGDNVVEVIDMLLSDRLQPQKQDKSLVTYAKKISKDEALIDFNQDAFKVSCKIRSLSPYPGAYFIYRDQRVKILNCGYQNVEHKFSPAAIVDNQMTIACQNGFIKPLIIQREGKKPMSIEEFLRGSK